MPNWKTHLEISNQINKVYGFKGMDFKKLLLGSILPDINNSHIVKEISQKINHEITHCYAKEVPSYLVFYRKYKKEIENKNPIFIGYVTHLYTDFTWNNNFYTNVSKRNYPDDDKVALRVMKQSDFRIFNNQFENRNIDILNDEELDLLEKECKNISEVSITKEDISKVTDFLKENHFYDAKLQFYTIEELDILLKETVQKLTKI